MGTGLSYVPLLHVISEAPVKVYPELQVNARVSPWPVDPVRSPFSTVPGSAQFTEIWKRKIKYIKVYYFINVQIRF